MAYYDQLGEEAETGVAEPPPEDVAGSGKPGPEETVIMPGQEGFEEAVEALPDSIRELVEQEFRAQWSRVRVPNRKSETTCADEEE